MIVVGLFLPVPWIFLQFVIMVFPDTTYFDFVIKFETDNWYLHDIRAMFGQIRL